MHVLVALYSTATRQLASRSITMYSTNNHDVAYDVTSCWRAHMLHPAQ
jgi:hypothetical protein